MQPQVNIGLVGHVDHGKTTLTQQLSGVWADTHSEELKRGITIRLGYADTTIYSIPGKKGAAQYTVAKKTGEKENKLVRKLSLIDAPGHESLMATMLAGASLMDGALLLVAANEHCPQPQTIEHLMALDIAGINNVIVVQNKVDLVTNERAQKNHDQIRELLSKTRFKDAPIVPISAVNNVNIDLLLSVIEEHIPTPDRDLSAKARFFVARSFDTNKPGTPIKKLSGGVLGGAVFSGKFDVGDEVEIRPGRIVEEANQKVAHPIKTKIVSMRSGGEKQDALTPGGSAGLMTQLDPAIARSDLLSGSLVGRPGELPDIWYTLELSVNLLERVVGTSDADKVAPLRQNEMLLLNVHSATTVGIVTGLGKNKAKLGLRMPICADIGDRVTLSRRIGTRFRLIGYGTIVEGKQ